MTRMRVSLVTLGDPNKQTGGYLYHRRLADVAGNHDADLTFASFPEGPFPVPALFGRSVIRRIAGADVVVVDSIATAFAAPWLGLLAQPVAGMLHQNPGGIDHGRLRRSIQAAFDRRALRAMKVVMVASESLHAEMRGLHDDIRVVAPGRDVAVAVDVDIGDLRKGTRAAILCVGNWVRRKGIVALLDAFAMLPHGTATLHLVGDDEADPRYARQVRERIDRLRGRVVVHGVVSKERVAALYRAADIFVMASSSEPYGTVYGEAMAQGLPVVGWRAGNLPYLARDGHEALLVEPGDVSGLAATVKRLADDPDLRVSVGQAARVRAETTFPTWDETAERFFSVLREL